MDIKLLEIIKENSKPMKPVSTGLTSSGNAVKNIKCIVFDIYGTLLQSASGDIGSSKEYSKDNIFLETLQKSEINILNNRAVQTGLDYFYEEIDLAHARLKLKGIDYPEVKITEIWETVLAKLINEELIEAKNIKIKEFATLFECLVNHIWPMPGLLKVLRDLKNKNIILGIISNAQFYTPFLFKALLGFTIEELGFNSELIEYSFITGEAKPSPKMFLKVKNNLLNKFNISPGDTLYVGNDMLNDIYSAQKEGFKTALFAGDLRSLRLRQNMPQLAEVKPDIVITELNHIIDLVK